MMPNFVYIGILAWSSASGRAVPIYGIGKTVGGIMLNYEGIQWMSITLCTVSAY
jgi:hypothetical protein